MNKINTTVDEKSKGNTPAERGFLWEFLASLKTSVIATLVLAVIVSGAYPLIVWAIAQVAFHHQANGSLVDKNGKPVNDDKLAVGSSLLGQSFPDPDGKYFHMRPSAAGSGYDGTNSGGSNLGPTSAKLMLGTTKNYAFTVFVGTDKSHSPVVTVDGRVQGTFVKLTSTTAANVTSTTITVKPADPGAAERTDPLDPALVDPKNSQPAVSYHGRKIHATTIAPGALVELRFTDKTVSAINIIDPELDGTVAAVDTNGNKITLTLADNSSSVFNVDSTTLFVVNGKTAALGDIKSDMAVHMVPSVQMDYDGIADRVIQYCQANKIDYKSTAPDSNFAKYCDDNNIDFKSTVPDPDKPTMPFNDPDGIDDVRLVAAFNAATSPTITPVDASKRIPADAVTGSGSGLDPHISPANAQLQAQRIADARSVKVETVNKLIEQYTDAPSLGFLGEPGVNVLLLNLALDREAGKK